MAMSGARLPVSIERETAYSCISVLGNCLIYVSTLNLAFLAGLLDRTLTDYWHYSWLNR